MSLPQAIKNNPLAAIGLSLTLAGVAISLVNFLILNSIQPLDQRVKAVEIEHQELKAEHIAQQQALNDIPVIKTDVINIKATVEKMDKKLDSLFIPRADR